MISAALSWFMGTKAGRTIALVLAGIATAAVVVFRLLAAGRAQERAKQTQQSLENLRERSKTDDEIASLPAADRRERLKQWVRPD